MRLVFFGSPVFAVPSLRALLDAGHEMPLVVTQPARPAGRGRPVQSTAVGRFAAERGLAVWETASVRGEAAADRLRSVGAEAMALAAYAALIPPSVLAIPPLGILNVHPSLLPRWRGAAPIQSALLAGDTETGVTIIRLVAAMDAGPVLVQARQPITSEDDYLSLEPTLAELGAGLLVKALAGVADGSVRPTAQDEASATYCRKLEREDGHIDWLRPAVDIERQVRALRGWPQAFTTWDGRLLKVLRAIAAPGAAIAAPGAVSSDLGQPTVGTGEGMLRLDEVQLEGKRPISGSELLRGYPALATAYLGT
ncbi:MAG: methionyl-tRNA formyltransferase [Chloroflexi bacterium]|nr:methionyl-tRNA formyltransferase [Chloroflexota bacterium]